MMRLLREGRLLLLIPLLIALTVPTSVANSCPEIDETGTVRRIIDGDTFYATPVGTVRLADIDTPEVGEPGAGEAMAYLASLVKSHSIYLDVDDLFGRDTYGRVVAVVYVRHNSTHLLNVNKAMLEKDLAVVSDFPNEFDPAEWKTHLLYPTEARPTLEAQGKILPTVTAIIAVVTVVLALGFLRVRRRPRAVKH